MPEPLEPRRDAGSHGLHGDSEQLDEGGSSALEPTHDGHLERGDVADAPFQRGTDPLGDRTIARRSGRASMQVMVFAVLAAVFAAFFVADVVNGQWFKAALGAVVLLICGLAITREMRGRSRD